MKKAQYLTLLLLIGIIAISGCIQNPNQNEIQFTDMNEELDCIDTFRLRDNEVVEAVINTNAEYQALFNYKSPSPRCENFELPVINFSQHTLLGQYADGGGCSIDFSRKALKDDLNKKLTYSVKVTEDGMCQKMGMSMNWALISKVPSDYSVVFEVE